MLYAAGVPNEDMMKNAPQVGIASVWWEGNPCNTHRMGPSPLFGCLPLTGAGRDSV